MIIFYTIMHFYLYEIEVTFKDGILRLYKNAFLMAFATMPMCLLMGAVIVLISFVLLSFLTPVAIMIVAFILWISVMRFMVDFYTARVIKKQILPRYENTDE